MTNKQLAAARRAMNRFPGLGVRKHGAVLIPYRLDDPSAEGAPITVTDEMQDSQIARELQASCGAVSG